MSVPVYLHTVNSATTQVIKAPVIKTLVIKTLVIETPVIKSTVGATLVIKSTGGDTSNKTKLKAAVL